MLKKIQYNISMPINRHGTDFFALFKLDRKFDIDINTLDERYYELQREFHPDNFSSKPDNERFEALNKSMKINDAYNTLKSPLRRAMHILKLNNVEIEDDTDAELFSEIMQTKKQIEKASSKEELENLYNKIQVDITACITKLKTAFSKDGLHLAMNLVTRLKYLKTLAEEIEYRKR